MENRKILRQREKTQVRNTRLGKELSSYFKKILTFVKGAMTVDPKANTETKRCDTNSIMKPFPQGLCLKLRNSDYI